MCREALLGDASRGPQARETARTAELDNAGLVQLQRDTMREQDESLERLEQSVMGTRVRCGNPNSTLLTYEPTITKIYRAPRADTPNIADMHCAEAPGSVITG